MCVESCGFVQELFLTLFLDSECSYFLFFVNRILIGGFAGMATIVILTVVIVSTCSVVVFKWKRKTTVFKPLDQTQGSNQVRK